MALQPAGAGWSRPRASVSKVRETKSLINGRNAPGVRVLRQPAIFRASPPITAAVLVLLFLVQRRGTTSVGHLFGPVMLVWFAVIAVDGLVHIVEVPRVLAALNPAHAIVVLRRLPAQRLHRARCGVNWLLLASVLALVVSFKSSSALASAYGFAVTGVMTLTTVLAGAVMRGIWGWPMIGLVLVPIMIVDLALFGSNSLKIPSGAWFPLVIGLVIFTIMSTWRAGRRLVLARLASETVPLAEFLTTCDKAPEARISGTAVFLSTHREHVPPTLVQNLKHNKILHRTVLLVRVTTDNVPRVPGPDRIKWHDLGHGFWQIDAHFGFAQTPNVPRELQRAEIPGVDLTDGKISYFVGRANVKSAPRPGMARWREHLYVLLSRLATRTPEFFRIPPPIKSSNWVPSSRSAG